MTKPISKKRMEEIRAGVADYIAKLERGEISNDAKPAGIGFSIAPPGPSFANQTDVLKSEAVIIVDREHGCFCPDRCPLHNWQAPPAPGELRGHLNSHRPKRPERRTNLSPDFSTVRAWRNWQTRKT